MKRTLEPELMDDSEQALAYARADFETENQGFVDRFREYFPEFIEGHILTGMSPGPHPKSRICPSVNSGKYLRKRSINPWFSFSKSARA